MHATSMMVNLAEAGAAERGMLGGKAATLAELSAAGFAVPLGIVVTASVLDEPDLDGQLQAAAARLGGDRFAVRSSGVAEDLPDASYAGLYESYLNVVPAGPAPVPTWNRCSPLGRPKRWPSWLSGLPTASGTSRRTSNGPSTTRTGCGCCRPGR